MKKTVLYLLLILLGALGMGVAAETPLKVAWSSTDFNLRQTIVNGRLLSECPSPLGEQSQQLTAWRGERLHAKVLIWTSGTGSEVSFTVNEPEDNQWVDETTTGFLRYVMADELDKEVKNGCEQRLDKRRSDSLMVADRIDPIRTMRCEAHTVQPLWITFDVPRDATPGIYRGTVTVKQSDKICSVLPYSIRVTDRILPKAEEQKFHLDLWQNPFAVARVANVPLWSKAHFDAMRPLMERLARAGQRGITTSITHKPWNGQTYDYFESMITEIRRADGTWLYDYTVFDRWVEFMLSCGVGPYIYCYSVIPWELTFRYYDQATNAMMDKTLKVDSPEFDEYWISKLKAFALHLKEKGWFERTMIAMDERPAESMRAALRVIRGADADYKISLAGNYHEELNNELFDLCIPYDSRYPEGVADARRGEGKITTFYTCCTEAFPNTFSTSQPIEAKAFGLIAAERGLDGYLRWAFNSWVESPAEDSRFRTWPAGDTYLVYPDNQSSVRFEKLIEGIQMFEKIQVLRAETWRLHDINRLLEPFAHDKLDAASLPKSLRRMTAWLNSR